MLRRIALLCLLPLLLCSACGKPVPEESSSLEESSAPQRITTIEPTWSTDDIYTAGDIVVHNGGYYLSLIHSYYPVKGSPLDEHSKEHAQHVHQTHQAQIQHDLKYGRNRGER